MGQVIGELLPLALGVAISPIPIIAVILMLLAPRAGAASAGFLVGWLVGIAVATTVFHLLAGTIDLGTSSDPSDGSSRIRLILGVALVVVAVRRWRTRPRAVEEPALPKWMAALDSITVARAAALAFALAAINPKNLLLCAAAGTAIGTGDLNAGQDFWAVLVFTVLAGSTVLVPVLGYAVARQRIARPLDELRTWLTVNNAVVTSVLLLVLGVVLIGKGGGHLF